MASEHDRTEWLAGLKPGDEVAARFRGIGTVQSRDKVKILVRFGRNEVIRFNKRGVSGKGFDAISIYLVTDEVRAAVAEARTRARLLRLIPERFSDLPTATLQRVVAALEAE